MSWSLRILAALLLIAVHATTASAQRNGVPRTADGRPDLQGIWQARTRAAYDLEAHAARHGMPAGLSVVDGGTIPYQPWAAARKQENYDARLKADPIHQCYMA